MRMTKIVCTLGPALDDDAKLEKAILAGMDVARFNFSHGTHEEMQERINRFKRVREKLGIPVAMVLDIKGPKIRLEKFENNEVTLVEGDEFVLCHESILGNSKKASTTYRDLYSDVNVGGKVLINDGLVALEVTKIENKDVYCKVVYGGVISNSKGINLPEANMRIPVITPKDIDDIKFGIENDFDFVACSLVRKPENIEEVRNVLRDNDGMDIKIIAKIENREGVNNIDEIIKVSDGIMVARGDMGVEIPAEQVPLIQKMIIERCYKGGKPVITATQMLESMVKNPRPTRAEVCDVANAVFDGTSAVMLSAESAAGNYPVESITTMARIADKAEEAIDYAGNLANMDFDLKGSITNVISYATCTAALKLNSAAIISVTESGETARMLSRFRPQCPIIAATSKPKVQRQLSLSWGVLPLLVDEVASVEQMFNIGAERALSTGLIHEGDTAVITAGGPVGVAGTTNLMKVHKF